MSLIKPIPSLLAVWRLRLTAIAILPAFLSACFVAHINWLWWLCTCAWICTFLYFYIFFFPIQLLKLGCGANDEYLLLHCGVIYTRVKAIPFTSIQYTGVYSTPLGRLFGVYSLSIYAAGASAYMPGLSKERALSLQEWLAQKSAANLSKTASQPIEKPEGGMDGFHV